MAFIQQPESFTPRELETMRYEKEQADAQMAYGLKIKELEIELQKLESRWAAWLRLPALIIKLPLLLVMGIAYIVHAITRIEPSENFWNLLK